MTDTSAPTPDDVPAPAPADAPADAPLTPEQIEHIQATAEPATVRRAPRYKGFFTVGAVVGIVLGLWLGLWLSYDGMVNRWIYVLVTIFGTSLVTVLAAGIWAVLLDRRGAAKVDAQRAALRDR